MSRTLVRSQDPWARFRRAVDWVVLTLAIGIVTLGCINLNSAEDGTWSGRFVTDQLAYLAIGSVAMTALALIDYRVFYRLGNLAYGLGFSLVLLVTIIGQTINKASRWLDLGAIRFQPSELMKLMLIIGIARYLHLNAGRKHSFRNVVVPLVMASIPALLIARQPDLSTAIILMLIAGTLLAATQLSWRSGIILTLSAAVSMAVAWFFFLEDYQTKRIDAWLDPEAHAKGAYQILQARIAVGNGGFLGRGVEQGTQNVLRFVPYKESDFSFAVFAEEWGFLGSSLLLAIYAALVLWAMNLASQARDRFGAILCVGVGSLFFWHVVLNVGVVLEFFPNTGLPLPFFSHGGSNVVTLMMALGILMSVSRSRHWR